jgi:hypothetical protein
MLAINLAGCDEDKLSNEKTSKILGSNNIPSEYIHAQFAVDMTDLKQVVGDADYIFVCRIKGYL